MGDRREDRAAERVDRMVADLLAGSHLKATPSDVEEREAIRVAARLAGIRDGYPRMSPAFRRRVGRVLASGESPPWIDRRTALVAAIGLTAGAAGGVFAARTDGLLGAASRPAPAPSAHPAASRGIIEPRPELGQWVDTGVSLSDLVENVPMRVTAGAIGAFLVRRGGQVIGMSAYCTHLPCELVWLADRKVLNCPCHNLAFDTQGQSLQQGYQLPALPYVTVRVRSDGRVEVLGTK